MTTGEQPGPGRDRREPPTTHARGSDRTGGVPPGCGRGRPRGREPPGLPGTLAQRVAVVLALLVAAASVGVAASVATAAGATQPGLVGVPDGQIDRNVPAYAADAIPDRAAWDGVAASRGAGSLDVTVTTRAAARGRAAACRAGGGPDPPFCDDPELAVVLSDTENHRGRTVAIPLDAVRDATGRVPAMAFGTHSSGDRWRTPTRVADGYLLVDVPRFSTNTVTFSGTVSLSADPASNGTTLSYNLSDLDAASAPNVTLVGRVATETDTETGTAMDSSAQSVAVAGDLDPTDERLALAGYNETDTKSPEVQLDNHGGEYNVSWGDPEGRISLVKCRSDKPSGSNPADFACDYALDGGPWIEFGTGTVSPGESTVVTNASVTLSPSSTLAIRMRNTDGIDSEFHSATWDSGPPHSVTATIDGTAYDFGDFAAGERKQMAVDLSTSTAEIDLSWTGGGGLLDYNLTYRERSATTDPTVEINNGSVSYAGGLSAGETVNLTGDAAWLTEGRNNVTVSVGDGSLSSDAPAPEVAVAVEHDAASDQSVSYSSETWSERYNVSKTWASDRASATLTVPFDSKVLAVRDAEVRTDGGAWSDVAASSIQMDKTTATIDLGSVQANSTTDVRVNGSKAPAVNGSYHVVDPTVLGDSLATEIGVDSAPVAIDVSGTPDGSRLHYLSNATWDASERSRVTSSGANVLRLPDATSGDRATVRVLPLEPRPETGDVVIEPVDPDGTPEFRVRPGEATGDEVVFRYHQAVDGHRYVLESVSAGTERDSAVAESPVDLFDDDSSELLRIFDAGETTTTGVGDGGPGGGPVRSAGTPLESTPVLFGSILFALLGVAYAGRRWLSGWQQVALLVVGGGAGALVVVERASTEPVVARLVAPVGEGLGKATPVVAMFGVVIVGYAVWQWADGRDIVLSGRLRK